MLVLADGRRARSLWASWRFAERGSPRRQRRSVQEWLSRLAGRALTRRTGQSVGVYAAVRGALLIVVAGATAACGPTSRHASRAVPSTTTMPPVAATAIPAPTAARQQVQVPLDDANLPLAVGNG